MILLKGLMNTLNCDFSSSELSWFKKWQQLEFKINWDRADYLLNKVSRTFALNIQVLPLTLKQPILLAYLFCRIADTLEDSIELSVNQKQQLISSFSSLFSKESFTEFKDFLPSHWADNQNWENLLTYHCETLFKLYSCFPRTVQKIIATHVQIMCGGMKKFLAPNSDTKTSHGFTSRYLIQNNRELDEYCYFVAGVVGKMLCALFFKQSLWINNSIYKKMMIRANSFGLGLQLTNILKDIYSDKDRHIMFLPHSLLKQNQLTLDSIYTSQSSMKMRLVLRPLIQQTLQHLEEAVEYCCLLPRWSFRIRLFCLWPLFMALETLLLIAERGHYLANPVKISRKAVKNILSTTSYLFWNNYYLKKQFQNKKDKIIKFIFA